MDCSSQRVVRARHRGFLAGEFAFAEAQGVPEASELSQDQGSQDQGSQKQGGSQKVFRP